MHIIYVCWDVGVLRMTLGSKHYKLVGFNSSQLPLRSVEPLAKIERFVASSDLLCAR